jgi:tetratricopeptide (TPR) repeat protein
MRFLSSSLLLARIRGVELRFHFSMLFSIPIAYYLFRPANAREVVVALLWLAGFVICILLHEVGHAFTAQLVGVEVKSIVIWILGGFTNLSRKAENPAHNLAISAAGPLVNMVLGFLCTMGYIVLSLTLLPFYQNVDLFLWGQVFKNMFFSLAVLNVILVLFNLLPIYPLDGGNILHSAAEIFFGRSHADWITLLISLPVLLGLVILGLFTRDYLLLVSCILIGLAVGSLNRSFLRSLNLGLNYLFRRSGYYYLQGDYERAIQNCTRDIEREPQQPNHYLVRAACYLNIFQKERAIADVERALKHNPDHVIALQLRGEIYTLEKDYDSALDFCARVQALNPRWPVPYFDRGSVLLDKGEFQSALTELDKAISFPPPIPLFFVLRSLTHFSLGNIEASHTDQDAALRLSEKDALVMTELNLSIYEGHLSWAEDYYARVIAKKPRLGYAFHGRADAYRANHEHKKAIMDYTHAIELMPKEASLYLSRGKSHLALNNSEQAKADLQQTITLADKSHLKRQAEEFLKNL